MDKKPNTKKSKGTAGGAAVAGGIGFQESVASLAIAHAVLNMNDYSVLGITSDFDLKSIHLETAHAIDDIVLVGATDRALIQAKRTVSLSDQVASDYSSALKQFVTHHFTERAEGDRYILATSIRSSARIIFDLRKLTESVRLNANALRENPLTEAETEVVTKTHRLISCHISAVCGRPALQTEVDEVFGSIWVLPLDLDPGGRDEFTAITLLRSRSKVSPKLVWNAIANLAKSLAEQRASVDLNGLEQRFGHFFVPLEKKKTVEDEFKFEVSQKNNIASGKEIVIFDQFMGSGGYSIVEFNRFSEDGSRRLRFQANICTLLDGSDHRYIYRSATIRGTERFLRDNQDHLSESRINIIPYNGDDDPNASIWAIAHQDLLTTQMQSKASVLKCVVCGDPVSENKALLVEIDEDGVENDIGYAHTRCHRPSLRVLGELQSELFSKYAALKDFDFQSWVLSNKFGPGILFSMSVPAPIVQIGWKPGIPTSLRGKWCIQITLDDGSSHYVTDRGKVHRFSSDQIDAAIQLMNDNIEKGIRERNPHCVTPDHAVFGNYSTIAQLLKPGQRLLRWKKAKAVEFTLAIDKAYSHPGNFYAPLTVLTGIDSGNPIVTRNTVFLISRPLDVAVSLDNWREAGLSFPEYGVTILEKDVDFDKFTQHYLDSGINIIIDPVFSPRGELLKGYIVETLSSLIKRN